MAGAACGRSGSACGGIADAGGTAGAARRASSVLVALACAALWSRSRDSGDALLAAPAALVAPAAAPNAPGPFFDAATATLGRTPRKALPFCEEKPLLSPADVQKCPIGRASAGKLPAMASSKISTSANRLVFMMVIRH